MAQTLVWTTGTEAAILAASMTTGEIAVATDTGLVFAYDGTQKQLVGRCLIGLESARPTAEIAGRFYLAPDTGLLYIDSGAEWVAVNPDVGVDAPQLENSLIMLAWEVYSTDTQFDDISVDDLETEDGIDTVNSVALYNAAGDYYSKDAAGDIDLITESWEASANDPTDAYAVIRYEDVDTITVGTDLKVFASMNDGTDYEELATYDVFLTFGAVKYLRADLSGLTARSDSTMRLRIRGYSGVDFKVHALSLGVRFSA